MQGYRMCWSPLLESFYVQNLITLSSRVSRHRATEAEEQDEVHAESLLHGMEQNSAPLPLRNNGAGLWALSPVKEAVPFYHRAREPKGEGFSASAPSQLKGPNGVGVPGKRLCYTAPTT